MSSIKSFINEFGSNVNGESTSEITGTAYSVDKMEKLKYHPDNPNGLIKATYATKFNFVIEEITNTKQIKDDAIVFGIVNDVSSDEDNSYGVGSAEYATMLIPAKHLSNDKLYGLGRKLIIHELGHIFGLGHSKKGAMKTKDASNNVEFNDNEKVEMNRNLIGNWYEAWKKIKSNKGKAAPAKSTAPMKSNFEYIYNRYGR